MLCSGSCEWLSWKKILNSSYLFFLLLHHFLLFFCSGHNTNSTQWDQGHTCWHDWEWECIQLLIGFVNILLYLHALAPDSRPVLQVSDVVGTRSFGIPVSYYTLLSGYRLLCLLSCQINHAANHPINVKWDVIVKELQVGLQPTTLGLYRPLF